ncbi:MAG: type III-A CRISPR-associated RAMP protein Csm4 [Archaeoglobaceae archaeon]|nr:type III-A CRISPR-associated RAMP protein Csm4 [Archaeoglobaceae archaeon]MCX8152683.1 type III-A CRISPR-associated RAMP protein Csm4 [Archaeoglobaceae archaeon]
MKVYKLEFKTPLCSGGVLEEVIEFPGSDTIFSAVATTIAETEGEKELIEFCESNPRFSSTFPFFKEKLFIPKPVGLEFLVELRDVEEIKKIKDLRWIEKNLIEKIDKDKIIKFAEKFNENEIFVEKEIARCSKNRINESTNLFMERVFLFSKDAGLYFFYKGEKDLKDLLKILGKIGIGGKKSIGFGKFKVSCEKRRDLFDGELFVLISKCFPKENEIEKILYYKIEERSGWSKNGRKRKIRVLKEGSILKEKIDGRMLKEYGIYRNYLATVYPIRW